MWKEIDKNLPMNSSSFRYLAGYLNDKGSPVFFKANKTTTNHYWDAEKFNSIKKLRIKYPENFKVFKLSFEFKLEYDVVN